MHPQSSIHRQPDSLHHWLESPAGQHLLAWEQTQCDAIVADVFGFHALQVGLPGLEGLRANRMPNRWLAVDVWPHDAAACNPSLYADSTALPFGAASLDLVVLPHTLDLSHDPHASLREVGRVLVPEGRVLILGFNPTSLWGVGHALGRRLPEVSDLIGHLRMRDWLRLLGFDVMAQTLGCYRPDLTSTAWFERLAWLESVGARAWPFLGSVYCVQAIKRVPGMRLLAPAWKTARTRRARTVPSASRDMR